MVNQRAVAIETLSRSTHSGGSKDRESITFKGDGRSVVSKLRDAVLQPDDRYIPIANEVGIWVYESRMKTEVYSVNHRTKASCTYEDTSIRGMDIDGQEPLRAVLNFTGTIEKYPYLSSGLVEFEFIRGPDQVFADSCEVTGQMESSNFETGLPLTQGFARGGPGSVSKTTTIETTTDALGKLLEVHEFENGSKAPCTIRVKDGAFSIDTRDEEGCGIYGELPSGRVDGPDLVNQYPHRPLYLLTRRFDGSVTLKTCPGGPLEIVIEESHRECRYQIEHSSE